MCKYSEHKILAFAVRTTRTRTNGLDVQCCIHYITITCNHRLSKNISKTVPLNETKQAIMSAMRVVVAILFVLAIATAFVPLKFSPALTKAIKGKGYMMSERNKMKGCNSLPDRELASV